MKAALVKTSQVEEDDPGPSLDPFSPYPLRCPLGETQWRLWISSDTAEWENYSGYIVLFHLGGKIHAPFKWNYHFPLHICKTHKETTGGTKVVAILCKQVLTISRGESSSPFCEWDQIRVRNLLNPTSDHITPLLWTVQNFHPTSTHCPVLRDQLPPHPPVHFPQRHWSSCCSSKLPRQLLPYDPLPQTHLSQVIAWLPPSCHSGHVRH